MTDEAGVSDNWYAGALAEIHDSDYTFLARAAAQTAMALASTTR